MTSFSSHFHVSKLLISRYLTTIEVQIHKNQEAAPCEPTGYMLHSGSGSPALEEITVFENAITGFHKDDLESREISILQMFF